ncbi:hypothetical protein MVEN_01310800 [Mycena venus]|uniref:Uncharacterized protein n=1 Tax=Mycena venus TaxID=2733690 RepID=A0A8H6Y178_9AGAR|nr:hypothetical protein MVEN_01310800 [Mycena venus]
MAVVSAIILVVIAGVYVILTFHPLLYLDSPYRTPLSRVFWGLFRRFQRRWRRRRREIDEVNEHAAADNETIFEAITREATEPSEARTAREGQALIWTVKSLSDESELEPFVEAIPRTLWALGVRRDAYSAHFRELVLKPDVALYSRIRQLLESCDTGLLSFEARSRRLILCYQALWAVTTLFVSPDHRALPFPDQSPLPTLESSTGHAHDAKIRTVSISAGVLMKWIHWQSVRSTLMAFQQTLIQWEANAVHSHEPDLSPLIKFLSELSCRRADDGHLQYPFPWPSQIQGYRYPPQQKCAADIIPELTRIIDHILWSDPYYIWFRYLRDISDLDSLPAYFSQNLEFIQLPPFPPLELQYELEELLSAIVSRQLKDFNADEHEWMDRLLQTTRLIPMCLDQAKTTLVIPSAVVQYLCRRESDKAVFDSIGEIDVDALWDAFAHSLMQSLDSMSKPTLLNAFWRITLSPHARTGLGAALTDRIHEIAYPHCPSLTTSIVALIKSQYLRNFIPSAKIDWADAIFPSETAAAEPPEPDTEAALWFGEQTESRRTWLAVRSAEARFLLVADFLDSCARAGLDHCPFEPVKTLRQIQGFGDLSPSIVHSAHEGHLANAIQSIFANPLCNELRTVIINFDIFSASPPHPTGDGGESRPRFWLNDEIARGTIEATFRAYAQEISASGDGTTDLPPGSGSPRQIGTFAPTCGGPSTHSTCV